MKIREKIAALSAVCLIFTLMPSAHAAPVIVFNGLFNGCVNVFTGNNTYAVRMRASSTTKVSGININVGSGLNSNWSTTNYWIVSHNNSTNMPGVILETFTADATNGSGANTTVHFSGSYTINAGTLFYLLPSVSFSTFPVCYTNAPPTADLIPNVGLNVDTSTSLTNTSWNKVISTGPFPGQNSSSWSTPSNVTQIWQLSIEASPPVAVSAALSVSGGNQIATYKTNQGITVSVDTPSRVTFMQNGKRIANCINILSSAGVATCNWKPTSMGSIALSAIAKPISTSYLTGSTPVVGVLIQPRTTIR